jgi:hypothetical protein
MSSVSAPFMHGSYPFRASMLLSQSREVVRKYGAYELRASMENSECLLTIAQQEQEPHINEVFEDATTCEEYMREHDLPTSGWCPVELVKEPVIDGTQHPFYG